MNTSTKVMRDDYGQDTAKEYDDLVSRYAWGYLETLEAICYESIVVRARTDKSQRPFRRVLDLGTGTGALIDRWLRLAKNENLLAQDTEIYLHDRSEEMLKIAQSRVEAYGIKPVLLPCTCFTQIDFSHLNDFDLILSSFAIHHLNGLSKVQLFEEVLVALHPGGRFILGDRMVEESERHYWPSIQVFAHKARPVLQSRAGKGPLEFDELCEEAVDQFRGDGDQPSSLDFHLSAFSNSGFVEVRNPFVSFGQCVISGQKSNELKRS